MSVSNVLDVGFTIAGAPEEYVSPSAGGRGDAVALQLTVVD